MAHLITGYKGSEHIKSADQGSFNAAFFGAGQFVMEIGNQFEGSIINNNTVRILDGDLLMYGRHVRIEPNTYEDLTVTTGTAGKNRIDLVCMTYEKNTSDGTEKAYLQVVKGTETEGTAAEPAYVDGNILNGATKNQMLLYKLQIQGVVLKSITQVFKTIPTYKTLAEQYAAQFEKACNTYLGALNILDTMEEVSANTKANQLAGALALKEAYSTLNSNITDIKGKYIVGSFVVKAGETATTPAISSNYNGLRLYFYDGNNGLRQSVIIPIVYCNIPYMTNSGIKYVNMHVNANRSLTFKNDNDINLVVTHMYAIIITQ